MEIRHTEIEQWVPAPGDGVPAALAEILHACVHHGASVGFILPFPLEAAEGYWRESVQPRVEAGTRVLLLAKLDDRIVGTVQLDTATMPNQVHRADVMKLLVHPAARRRGIARALMLAVEREAGARNRTLLTLDTGAEDSAEPLYLDLGYVRVGEIPGYSRAPNSEILEPTVILYKHLPEAANGRCPA